MCDSRWLSHEDGEVTCELTKPHVAHLSRNGRRSYTWRDEHALPGPPQPPLLEGATTPGDRLSWPTDPGEYAARWNAATPEMRIEHLRRLVATGQESQRCFEADHEGQLANLKGQVRHLTAFVGEVAETARAQALDDALKAVSEAITALIAADAESDEN